MNLLTTLLLYAFSSAVYHKVEANSTSTSSSNPTKESSPLGYHDDVKSAIVYFIKDIRFFPDSVKGIGVFVQGNYVIASNNDNDPKKRRIKFHHNNQKADVLKIKNNAFICLMKVVKTDGNYDLNEIPYAPLFSAKFPEFKFRATYDFDATAIGYIKGNLKVVNREVTMWDEIGYVGIKKLFKDPYYDVLFRCNDFIGIYDGTHRGDADKDVEYFEVKKSFLEEETGSSSTQ